MTQQAQIEKLEVLLSLSRLQTRLVVALNQNQRPTAEDMTLADDLTKWWSAREGKSVDQDGWIAWPGGPMPVSPGTMVMIKFRDPSAMPDRDNTPAGNWSWEHFGNGGDIVAYKPVETTKPAPEKDDDWAWWNDSVKEGFTPPADLMCEVILRNGTKPIARRCGSYRWSHTGAPDDIVGYRYLDGWKVHIPTPTSTCPALGENCDAYTKSGERLYPSASWNWTDTARERSIIAYKVVP